MRTDCVLQELFCIIIKEYKTLTVRHANMGTTQPKPEQESVLLHAQ